jgi:hypothetical protein
MARPGYIYILATAYKDGAGQQIIKIGRTSRSPKSRAQELSRGGPAGMALVGAVACRDMIELERRAHAHFSHARFLSGGGTEYFTASSDDVLKWLRDVTPRYDLRSSRKDAWAEYVETKPFKIQARLSLLVLIPGLLSPLAGVFFQPFQFWSIFAGPVAYVGILFLVRPSIKRLSYMQNLHEELELVQRELEFKYHLPLGAVRNGPPGTLE